MLDKYIKSLDLYIVSAGGVGSNYLVDYLNNKIVTKTDQTMFQNTCHRAKAVNVKTLFIYGDEMNAIISMYQRGVLEVNATKIHLGSRRKVQNLQYFLEHFPDDPVGIIKMYKTYCYNVMTLHYPYDKYSVAVALNNLGFDIDISDIKIKDRKAKDVSKILKMYNE